MLSCISKEPELFKLTAQLLRKNVSTWLTALPAPCFQVRLEFFSPSQGRIQDLKWGVNFSNNVREIKYYFNIRGI